VTLRRYAEIGARMYQIVARKVECTARSKAAVDHAAIRRWITLETGTASRSKSAVDHAANRHLRTG
jgi:hypothetical protein